MSTAGDTAVGAGTGAATGAAAGTAVLPGWGTAIGAGVGAVVGGVSSYFGSSAAEKAQKRKAAAWAKAQKLLAEAQLKRDQDTQALMRDAYTPANNALVGMYGSSGGVDMANMTRNATPKQQQSPSYAPTQPLRAGQRVK